MNLRIRTLALVPLVALALSACGGASEEEYADAMTSGLTTAETQPLSEPKATCVAESFTGRMGEQRLNDSGDTADFEVDSRSLTFESLELTEPEANELFDDFMDCGADMRSRVMTALVDEELALPDELMGCLEEAIDEGEMRGFFVPMMRSGDTELDPAVQTKVEGKLVTCFDGMELQEG